MKTIPYNLLFLCGLIILLAACTQSPPAQVPKNAAPSTPAKPSLMQPFRYHKLIESSPGQYFDVFSWGRGKDSSGAYMILHSDSTGKKYSTTTGDLEGAIIDVYNTDMNMDGHPEILIEAKAKDTTNHINIYAYEFRGANAQKLNFPKLTDKTKKLYRGDDNIYIKEGNLIREFPVYEGTGNNARPTGAKKILQYGFRQNEFSVKDISNPDTTKTKNTTPVAVTKIKKMEVTATKKEKKHTKEKTSKHKEKHPKKEKKHTTARKKRRHHRGD